MSTELRDAATSRVYLDEMDGTMVAVKKLKLYSLHHASALVHAYTSAFHVSHPKVCTTFGVCPISGWIILELCQKTLGGKTIHTLLDMMNAFGSEQISVDLKITALADVIEGLAYLHSKSIIHGDVKPLNVLVCGKDECKFVFKLADYGGPIINDTSSMQTSHSKTMKQLMPPGYMAPELLPGQVSVTLKPSKATDV